MNRLEASSANNQCETERGIMRAQRGAGDAKEKLRTFTKCTKRLTPVPMEAFSVGYQ
ncbi:hypothetical protein HBI56_164470 [Parastagonospora nodorum]|uniref:Uncharacterized protein n=1 Tax=Phaeosphaeria nodorum (strain SN15 / ATCC MYA-4574 / FGSC 10173) TaxID=321614 RepID=A0A7U2IB53_PHANO|nr:hypothetical protein HBH56_072250 [Parastagonospora nodorum]QRD06607.1 hypothetical protein JI435_423490 [Parastagonospora nodorum SN15]KAH3927496.1 hypothetical protein HBH54_152480 [Parastagonospora nodorum]KAH3952125.1 hypothetical protein HBH53_055890 [Parastagonospora nodorum]KAH3981961.1 hypothetical protein HBH51_039230 [Parastagonospora nodorum]